MISKVESRLSRLWIAAVLGSALCFAACEDAAAPAATGDDEDTSPVSDSEDDDDAPKPKPDAGKPKLDASVDAKAPPPVVDAGGEEVVEAPRQDAGGGDVVVVPPDAGEPAGHEDLGKGDGKDVITIGDSWMNYFVNGGGIERGLLAASGQRYRTYGVAGTQLLNGQIPNQYASAKRENPDIKTVVMAAGGNDILLTGANPATQIEKIGKRLDELWTEMGKDGVQDVVYIEYSEGGNNGANVRMGIEKVGPICTNHKAVRCHFLLSDPIIMKQLLDGIHPTSDGCTKLGKAAFDLMVAEGMRR
jgi:lysophospholipase L1-like esterase